jgi:hypothetical protein
MRASAGEWSAEREMVSLPRASRVRTACPPLCVSVGRSGRKKTTHACEIITRPSAAHISLGAGKPSSKYPYATRLNMYMPLW